MTRLPPRYVKVPVELWTKWPELSKGERWTAATLAALTWTRGERVTEAIPVEELADLCEVGVSTLYGHLSRLGRVGVLSYYQVKGDVTAVFNVDDRLQTPARASPTPESWSPLQKAGVHVVVESTPSGKESMITPGKEQQHYDSLLAGGESEGGNGRSPENQSEPLQKTRVDTQVLERLEALGILEPVRSELAGLEYVGVEYVEAWARWFEQQMELGVGGLVLQIRAGVEPPLTEAQKRRRSYERWGIRT